MIIGIGLYAAESNDEARHVFSSAQLQGLSLIRGRPGKLPPPVDNAGAQWSKAEYAALAQRTQFAAVGSPETVRHRLATYAQYATPVIEHYRSRPTFGVVDGVQHADFVTAGMTAHIDRANT